MSIITATHVSGPSIDADAGFLSPPWQGHTARLAIRRLKSWVVVVSAHGDVDASNAGTLTEYTLGHMGRCRGLVLDLRGVEFFGTEGFSALQTISARCASAAIDWAVLPGGAVSRVLRVCDPHASLTTAGSVEAALSTFLDPLELTATRRTAMQSSRCERTECAVCGGATGFGANTAG